MHLLHQFESVFLLLHKVTIMLISFNIGPRLLGMIRMTIYGYM